MHRRTFIKQTGAAGLITFIPHSDIAHILNQNTAANLEEDFIQPPSSAYPYVFWVWMNGNVTKEGITLDMEAMKRVGIGGVFNFDIGTGIPKGPVQYLSGEWLQLKKHAIQEANRLGLEFTMHNCPGWSASGGPWITPELAMQQITWSEMYVSGGKEITITLPKPLTRFNYYNDLAVLAFPSLVGEELLQTLKPTSNNGVVDIKQVTGEDPQGVIVYPAEDGQSAWLQFEFKEPYEARSITFFIETANTGIKQPELRDFGERTSVLLGASDDGTQFRSVTAINTGLEADLILGNKFIAYDFPVTKAKYFRLSSSKARRYKQVRFSGVVRLENWMEKSNTRATTIIYVAKASGEFSSDDRKISVDSVIDSNSILNISQYADKDGVLRWNAPLGDWTVLRIGFTPTGAMNRAAPDTGIGLECDKYSRSAIDFHFTRMMEHLLPWIKPLTAKGKMGLEIDSYEAGAQNWTNGFQEIFEKRWRYDLLKFLPAVAGGRIVGNVANTERFLWNFRRLQADLIAENYYGRFREL